MRVEHWLTILLVIATVVGPVLAAYYTLRHEQRFLADGSPEARALIRESSWKGMSTLDLGPEQYRGEYCVHLHLDQKRGSKALSGKYVYWVDPQNPNSPQERVPRAELEARGGFTNDRFLTLRLRSHGDDDSVHFGIHVYDLSTDKRQMDGIWIAFGLHAGQFIGGSLHLEKI